MHFNSCLAIFALTCITQSADMRWCPLVAFAVHAFVLCWLIDLPSVSKLFLLAQPAF